MSGLDVEALLDSTASSKEQTSKAVANGDISQNGSPAGRHSRDRERDRDRGRDGSRDRDRDRDRRHRDRSGGRRRNSSSDLGKDTPRSETGSHKSRRRSRSRDSGRHSRRHRGGDGDYYRGGSYRSRSRSPYRSYRPRGDDRRDREDRNYRRRDDDRGTRSGGRHSTPRDATPPPLTEDERDRRTVFVQQLAARLRTRELKEFFEKVGPVAEAQIVKDRVSNRSKG